MRDTLYREKAKVLRKSYHMLLEGEAHTPGVNASPAAQPSSHSLSATGLVNNSKTSVTDLRTHSFPKRE